jgi:hypothetical protein
MPEERYDQPHLFKVPTYRGETLEIEAFSREEALEKARMMTRAPTHPGFMRDVMDPMAGFQEEGVQDIPVQELLQGQLPEGETVDLTQELPGIMLRADLAQGSDLAVDQAAKIRESFFGDEAIQTRIVEHPVTHEAMVLARIPGEDHFVPIDVNDPTWGDFGDIIGHLADPEILGLVAGATAVGPIAMAARVPRVAAAGAGALQRGVRAGKAAMATGQRIGTTTAGAGFGTYAGTFAGAEVERLRGFNMQPFSEDLREAEENARLMRDFELGIRGVQPILARMAQPMVSNIFLRKGHAQRAAIETAQELGIPLVAADLHPLGRSALQIVARLGSLAESFQLDRLSTALRSLGTWGTTVGNVKHLATEELERIVLNWERELTAGIKAPLGRYRPGAYAQRGAVTYETIATNRVTRLYEEAKGMDGALAAEFDFAAASDVARRWHIGIVTPPGQGPLRGAGGKFMKRPVPQKDPGAPVRLDEPLGRAAKRLVDDLLAITGGTLKSTANSSGLVKMQRLRTRAFNLSRDFSERATGSDRRFAGELHHALSESLYNPVNAPPGFREALRKAGAANAAKERILDGAFMKTALGTQSRRDIGEVLMDPSRYQEIREARRVLKGVGDDVGWEHVRDGFRQKLLGDPTKLGRLMRDPKNERGLGLLLTPGEKAQLLKLGREYERFQNSLLVKHLRLQRGLGDHAVELIREGNAAELSNLVKRMAPPGTAADDLLEVGRNSAGGRALQAGIVQHIVERSTVLRSGSTSRILGKPRPLQRS